MSQNDPLSTLLDDSVGEQTLAERQPTTTGKVGDRRVLLAAGIALALCLAIGYIYVQTTTFDFVNYDDNIYVYDNARLAQGLTWTNLVWAFTNFDTGNWHPLTWVSHLIDAECYGLQRAGGHHLSAVLIHAATAVVLLLALWQLTGSLLSSAFAAAVFAVHPLRVESVAWVSERKDVLSGFFFALTLLAYAGYARRPSVHRYLTVLMAFACGLMCKSMLVTLPFVLLLLDYWPLGRLAGKKRRPTDGSSLGWLFLEKVPLVCLSLAVAAITVFAQKPALQELEALSIPMREANATVSYLTYIRQLFWPSQLVFFYPHPLHNLPWWQVVGAHLVLLATTAGAIALRRERPYLLVGWLWYLGMLIPVIGFVQVGHQAHADRYTYLPQIGLVIAITWWLADWVARRRLQPSMVAAWSLVVLAVLCWCAQRQTRHWRDSLALFSCEVECTTGNADAYKDIGAIWEDREQYDKAAMNFSKALEIRPCFPKALSGYGYALYRLGRYEEAVVPLRRCLELDPNFLAASRTLGKTLFHLNRFEESESLLRNVLERDARDAEMYDCLGLIQSRQGRWREAAGTLERGVKLDPSNAQIRLHLAAALRELPP